MPPHLLPETVRPEVLQPLIRILRLIHIRHGPVEGLLNVVGSYVVKSIHLVRTVTHLVRYDLNIVANLLGHNGGQVVELSVLEAELVAKVGADLPLMSATVS